MQRLTYPEWKAPSEDGGLILWPEPERIVQDTRENHRRLGEDQALIQNVPLSELRSRQRRWLGHQDNEQSIIASGHQTELYHPGVWVKDALGDAAAKKLGGVAYHFSVDT